MKKKLQWTNNGDNEILKIEEDWYISYNPNTNGSKSGIGMLYNMIGGALTDGTSEELESDGRTETALVEKKADGKTMFYILNGDFRLQYERIIHKGFGACHSFYLSQSEHKSNWSND